MQGTQTQVSEFGKTAKAFAGTLAAAFSFAEVANFFKQSLMAYAEQELAVSKLVKSLENQGIASDKVVNHLTGLATALQSTTGYADEAIISAQALMTSFGLQGEQMDRATKAAIDLSASLGIDLTQAAQLVGKAFVGETGALSRYGIIIDKNIDSSKKFEAVLGQVEGRFGGSAEAQAQTFTGQMKLLGVAFSELQETVGSFLAGPGAGVIHWLTQLLNNLTSSLQTIKSVSDGFTSFGAFLQTYFITALGTIAVTFLTIVQKLYELAAQLPIVGAAYQVMANNIATSNLWLQDQIVKLQAAKLMSMQATTTAVTGEKQKQTEYRNTATVLKAVTEQSSLFVKDAMKDEIKARGEHAEALKKAQKAFADEFITTEADMWLKAAELAHSFFTGVGDAFADMIVDGKSLSDSMKAVFRDMAKQIISYIVAMIAKLIAFLIMREAARQFGGAYGQAAAAAMTASANATDWGGSGMATGGMINEPSVLTGLRSGRSHMVGEAGPEEVVPMGGNMSNKEAGGRGGITINISGMFLDADESTWQRLMREKLLPEIRRVTSYNPTGPFNRRRGVS